VKERSEDKGERLTWMSAGLRAKVEEAFHRDRLGQDRRDISQVKVKYL
jgi:hypothetical protein